MSEQPRPGTVAFAALFLDLVPSLTTVVVAATGFFLLYEDGGFGLTARTVTALVVWWITIVALGIRLWPRRPQPVSALASVGLLAAFAGLSALSLLWSTSAQAVVVEVDRVLLYLGMLILVLASATRITLPRFVDGLSLALGAVALTALASRLFPGLFSDRGLATFLPAAQTRLSFPVGYWNGLAIICAMGAPLLVYTAASPRSPLVRALAVAVLPVMACDIYLASSRGGAIAAAIALAVFVSLSARRWQAIAVIGVSSLGAVVAIAALAARPRLINGPLHTAVTAGEGHSAAAIIAVTCLVAGGAYVLGTVVFEDIEPPPRKVGWGILVGVAAVATAAALAVVASPGTLDSFRAPPSDLSSAPSGFVSAHLQSANGSGRWQFWTAAIKEFTDRPLLGHGAGSFEWWWAAHGSISYFTRDAHSLYLQTLGELGIVGFLLIVSWVILGLVVGVRRTLSLRGSDRCLAAALLGVLIAWAIGAGIDWMWELSAVTLVAVVSYGLLIGPAMLPTVSSSNARTPSFRPSFGMGIAVLLFGWVVICIEAIPLLAQSKLNDSTSMAARGNTKHALSDALAARALEPWASSPYLQLALVSEKDGKLRVALYYIQRATDKDGTDWRLWLTQARLETKLGQIKEARRSLERARELNPRSPLFA